MSEAEEENPDITEALSAEKSKSVTRPGRGWWQELHMPSWRLPMVRGVPPPGWAMPPDFVRQNCSSVLHLFSSCKYELDGEM